MKKKFCIQFKSLFIDVFNNVSINHRTLSCRRVVINIIREVRNILPNNISSIVIIRIVLIHCCRSNLNQFLRVLNHSTWFIESLHLKLNLHSCILTILSIIDNLYVPLKLVMFGVNRNKSIIDSIPNNIFKTSWGSIVMRSTI